MGVLHMDGFDYYAANVPLTTRYTFTTNGLDNTATGRFGGKALTNGITGATSRMTHGFSAQSALSVGFAFKFNTATTSDRPTLYLRTGTTTICTLHLRGSDKKLVFTRGSSIGSNVLATSSVALINDTWHHVGLEFTRHASAGAVNLYLDGVQVATVTGVNSGASDIDTIEIEMFSNANTISMDDYYVVSGATWLGEQRIEYLPAASDTAQKDWTADTGSDNYARVDDVPMDGDTSYVFAANVSDEDNYGVTDLSSTPAAIPCVQVVLAGRKDDAATRAVAPILISGATTDVGDDVSMATGYKVGVQVYDLDPDGSVAWDAAAVNALNVGIRVTA